MRTLPAVIPANTGIPVKRDRATDSTDLSISEDLCLTEPRVVRSGTHDLDKRFIPYVYRGLGYDQYT